MRLLCLMIVVLLAWPLGAQVHVVPGGSGDGRSWTQALGNVKAALATGNTDIRVAVGVYELEEELTVGTGQILSGGWIPETGLCVGNAAQRTVLKAVKRCRVATVAGTMRGFTVTGGVMVNGKGGGVYVKTGGVVENCIISGNAAGTYYPRVGDAYCKGGTFLRKDEITVANAADIAGVVFWVNPDTTAGAGQRGWVMALKQKGAAWGTSSTGESYETMEAALQDTAGRRHTLAAVADGALVGHLAGFCHNYNVLGIEGWYMPALRQLLVMFGEKGMIQETCDEIAKYRTDVPDFSLIGGYLSSTEGKGKGAWGMFVAYTQSSGIMYYSHFTNCFTRPVLSF